MDGRGVGTGRYGDAMSVAQPAPSPGRSLRVLALTLGTSPLIVLVAILFVLPPDQGELSVLGAAAALGAVVLGFLAAQTIGYRVAALEPGLDEAAARRASVQAFQTTMILRFVLTEAPLIAALALSFVLDEGPWPFVLAVVVGVPSMLFHVLVRPRTIERVRAGLEARGARSYVAEALTP